MKKTISEIEKLNDKFNSNFIAVFGCDTKSRKCAGKCKVRKYNTTTIDDKSS